MSTITTRAVKGERLTWAEADANFNNLNTDKFEAANVGVDIQAWSANLDEYAAVNPTAAGLALLDDADASAQRTTLGLVIGTNVQAYSADAAFRAGIQGQTYTAFTTGGTSTAYTLTPTPATAANTTGQRFRVKFNAAAGTTPTLAVSGQTAASLKYYDSTGAKVAITATQVPINWTSDVEYDGTDWMVLNVPSSAAAAAVPTGVVYDYVGTTAPTGYVLLSGRTIGNGSSGGTERANADTSDLFTLLWNSMANAEAPVSSGRGASAAEDFAANKTITLPDARGRVIAGKDNMGGSTASRLTTAGGIVATTLGIAGGTETHTLVTAELASHTHGAGSYQVGFSVGGGTAAVPTPTGQLDSSMAVSGTSGSQGSGTAHKNTQPTLVLNKIIKL